MKHIPQVADLGVNPLVLITIKNGRALILGSAKSELGMVVAGRLGTNTEHLNYTAWDPPQTPLGAHLDHEDRKVNTTQLRTSRELFLRRPDNILEFAADYFTDPRLPNKIHMQLIKEKKAA
ncbi:RIIa domain-containing protein 1 isoform X2 [Nannospalax galili]|uniref:RIIa domain-containing protein 1 isoform X2 n=1 Tax=Nannospalax galili TaxID=1026970 RepID=UPI00111C50CA|nr:RIIa domain-containing protein 1 isoform X2 [Nannospalax galili]